MSDDDLIRRGDVLYAIAGWDIPSTAIAALPAQGVRVKLEKWTPSDGSPAWVSHCVVCGRIVDTREKDEGGDGHGCEYPEGWTCSSECAEKLHPDPEWMEDALAAEAGGVDAIKDALASLDMARDRLIAALNAGEND